MNINKNTENKLDLSLKDYHDDNNPIISRSALESDKESLISNYSSEHYFNSNRHYVPATKEWANSVYFYNKNDIKTIPMARQTVNDLVESYLSLNPVSKGKNYSRSQIREQRLSLDRILASKPEMKHTNEKVTLTLYLYNKNKKKLIYKLQDLYKTFQLRKLKVLMNKISRVTKLKVIKPKKVNSVVNKQIQSVRVKNMKTLDIVNQSTQNENNTNIISRNPTSLVNTTKGKDNTNVSPVQDKKNLFKNLSQEYINEVYKGKKSKENIKNSRIYAQIKTSKILKKEFETKRIMQLKRERKSMIRNQKMSVSSSIKISNYLNYAKITKNRINLFLSLMASSLEKRSNSLRITPVNTTDLTHKYITMLKKQNFSLLALSKYKLFTKNINPTIQNFDNISISTNNLDNSYINYTDFNNNLYTSNTDNNVSLKQDLSTLSDNIGNFKYPYLSLFLSRKRIKAISLRKIKYIKLDSVAKQSLKTSKGLLTKFKTFYKLFVLTNLNQKFTQSDNIANSAQTENNVSHKKIDNFFQQVQPLKLKPLKKAKQDSFSSERKLKIISLKSVKLLSKVRKYKNLVLKLLNWNPETFVNYENKYYKNFMKKAYRKELLYIYYVRMLSFNSMKFKNWFLLGLKKLLSRIYKKKIEFNFVNLKYLHLNSDIFSQSIVVKLKNKQNSLLAVLNQALSLVKLAKINKRVFYNGKNNPKPYNTSINNLEILQATNVKGITNDGLSTLLSNLLPNYSETKFNNNAQKIGEFSDVKNTFIQNRGANVLNETEKNVLDSLKHKAVFGVRLEAAGRLSKRITASRSVYKLRYKGNLKNLDATFHGLSVLTLRGNIKPNLQYTNISSKTRNGSFGLKGWVNSY